MKWILGTTILLLSACSPATGEIPENRPVLRNRFLFASAIARPQATVLCFPGQPLCNLGRPSLRSPDHSRDARGLRNGHSRKFVSRRDTDRLLRRGSVTRP